MSVFVHKKSVAFALQFFFVCALGVPNLCSADDGPRLSAGFIRVACNAHQMGAKDVSAVSICAMTIEGFIGGFTAGTDRGASVVLINDKAAMETVRGISDLQQRLTAIRPKARCLYPQITCSKFAICFWNTWRRIPRARARNSVLSLHQPSKVRSNAE